LSIIIDAFQLAGYFPASWKIYDKFMRMVKKHEKECEIQENMGDSSGGIGYRRNGVLDLFLQ